MQAPAQHEGINVGTIANVEEVLQKVAEHKGCGTSGGSGKASCGSAAGQGDLPTEIWEKVKEPSLLQRGSASPLRAHACRRGSRLQHSMQLLQSQI